MKFGDTGLESDAGIGGSRRHDGDVLQADGDGEEELLVPGLLLFQFFAEFGPNGNWDRGYEINIHRN